MSPWVFPDLRIVGNAQIVRLVVGETGTGMTGRATGLTLEQFEAALGRSGHLARVEGRATRGQGRSDKFVAAVQANEVPVEYVIFPDEGHGFRKRVNQVTASDAYVRFLDTYLKGESGSD